METLAKDNHICYGAANHSGFFRIPGHGKGRRIPRSLYPGELGRRCLGTMHLHLHQPSTYDAAPKRPRATQPRIRLPYIGVLLLLAVVFWSACNDDHQGEILVFTAASLTNVIEEVGDRFTEDTGIALRLNLGGSVSLAQQILRGAPADVFLSAGPEPMDLLETDGRLSPGTRVDFLTNELVVVGRSTAVEELNITSPNDLLNADVRLTISDADLTPAGRYSREALVNLGIWKSIESRIVPGQNVRVALGYVETGSVGVGIVYRTDLVGTDKVRILFEIPSENHSPIIYPAAAISESDKGLAAEKFLYYLASSDAAEIFRSHGFIPILP